jgi:hypothetical protein
MQMSRTAFLVELKAISIERAESPRKTGQLVLNLKERLSSWLAEANLPIIKVSTSRGTSFLLDIKAT